MAVMDVRNSSPGWLTVWLEPLGEDRWLRPGESVRIWSDYSGDEMAFSVNYWVDDDDRAAGIENVAVWIENGDWHGIVTDPSGNAVECGHQRPEDVDRKWKAMLDNFQRHIAEQRGKTRSAKLDQ